MFCCENIFKMATRLLVANLGGVSVLSVDMTYLAKQPSRTSVSTVREEPKPNTVAATPSVLRLTWVCKDFQPARDEEYHFLLSWIMSCFRLLTFMVNVFSVFPPSLLDGK